MWAIFFNSSTEFPPHDLFLKKMVDSKVKPSDISGQPKRNQIELIVEFLDGTREPVRKTHLLYRLQINHHQVQNYIQMLLKFGMIREVSDPFVGFLITEKGLAVLEMFDYARKQTM